MEESKKSWGITLALSFFLGFIGGQSFYVGRIGRGFAQWFTLGGLGIWSLIDFITIATGNFQDSEGKTVKKPDSVNPKNIFIGAGGFVLLIILMSSIGGGKEKQDSSSDISEKKEIKEEVKKGEITKQNCLAVKNGMNKDQVIALLGETDSQSEVDMPGAGNTEMWHYQDTGMAALATSKVEACDVHFSNGKVSMKSWTKL